MTRDWAAQIQRIRAQRRAREPATPPAVPDRYERTPETATDPTDEVREHVKGSE